MEDEKVHPLLGAVIPSSRGRKIAYALYGLAAFVVGNTVVYFAATQTDVPSWLIGAVAVVNNIAPVFGAVAIANIPSTPKQAKAIEVPVVEAEPVAMHASQNIPDPE